MTPAGRSAFKRTLSATRLAPVGKQAPPTRAAPSLVRALRVARGALLFATGTSLIQYRRLSKPERKLS